jgi:hypothetical protein
VDLQQEVDQIVYLAVLVVLVLLDFPTAILHPEQLMHVEVVGVLVEQ